MEYRFRLSVKFLNGTVKVSTDQSIYEGTAGFRFLQLKVSTLVDYDINHLPYPYLISPVTSITGEVINENGAVVFTHTATPSHSSRVKMGIEEGMDTVKHD